MINSGFFGNNQKWWMSRVFFIFLSNFYRFSSFFDSFYSFSSVSFENDKKDKKSIKKLIKKEKNSRHSPFLIVSEEARIYQFFIIFYHFPRKQRKMNKNYQKMMKNDKQLIKKWKKLETFTIFDCFRRSQNLSMFYHFFIIFQGNRGKWIKTIKKWWKTIKNDNKMKKTRDIHHFWLFPKQPRMYQFFINFLSIFFPAAFLCIIFYPFFYHFFQQHFCA